MKTANFVIGSSAAAYNVLIVKSHTQNDNSKSIDANIKDCHVSMFQVCGFKVYFNLFYIGKL